jgi:two-component system, NarL family, sensor histidine kinase DegS
MKAKLNGLSRRYLAALRTHLHQGPRSSLRPAGGLGRQALDLKLETLDLAMIHRRAMTTLVAPNGTSPTRDGVFKRAETFFVEAIKPIEQNHRAAMETNVQLNQLNQTLRQRTTELAAANRQLKQEIVRRRAGEEAVKKSRQHYRRLLEQSRHQQEQLRHLARQILSALEEERKEISRELHDEIAQTLTGINVHLASLTKEATVNTEGLKQTISRTQRLVESSVNIVHRFARELRPTLLDDLGLIPALHSFMKDFTKRTGIHIRFTAVSGVEQLNSPKRTVLYRVAQSALTNVAQHAHASQVKVRIRKLPDGIRMEIHDNGKSFEVERVLFAKRHKRLGLLGMRERVEMVGGSFGVRSAPGKGTTIRAQIPLGNGNRG